MGRIVLWCCLLGWGAALWAADPASRLKLSEPVQMRYRETRRLALLSQPWQGTGYLLADPAGTLVKLQLSPRRVIMIATPDRLLYYDASTGERHRVSLPAPLPQAEGIVLLQHLLRGDLEPVRRDYRIGFQEGGRGWKLKLVPKTPDSAAFKEVSLSGDLEGRRQVLEMTERDGDTTITEMTLDDRGAGLAYTIARLLREAAGE